MEKSDKYDIPDACQNSGIIGISWASSGGETSGILNDNALHADGIENCMKILEEIETGTLDSIDFTSWNMFQAYAFEGEKNARTGIFLLHY